MVAAPLGVVVPAELPQAAQLQVGPQLAEPQLVALVSVELGWVARQPGELPLVEPLLEVLLRPELEC